MSLPPFPTIPNPSDPDAIINYLQDMEAVLLAYEKRLDELLQPETTEE